MAEKERPLYTLYKGLKANNYDVPDSYDSFERTLTEAGNGGANSRHTLYNSLKEQNFDVPDTYERFYSNLFTPVNKTTSRALGGYAPMSDADKARFSAGAAAISAQAGQAMRRAKNTQRAAKLKQQQERQRQDFGRVDLGTNKTPYGTNNTVKDDFGGDPVTGNVGTYITSSGEEIGNEFEAGQQQQTEDKYNETYNTAVERGDIPSAFDVVDKNGNYDLYENVGKNGVHVTEQGKMNQLDAKISYANERLADIKARITEIDSRNGNPLLSYQASIGGDSGVSGERRQLGLAKTQVEEELRSLNAVRRQPDRNFLQNGWQGFSDTALNAKSWDFGLNDFALMGQMERIKAKIDNNIPLSNDEKRLAQSKLGADAAAALADSEMGKAYRWSSIAGQSVPFMLDFYLTGGFGGITHTAGKAAVKYAAKKGMGAFGKNVLKYTGVTAANIVGSYAMAGTEQAFKTGADIMNRHMGTLYQDEDGNYKFGTFDDNGNLVHDGGEGFGTALYKGMTAAMLENYTEKVFRHTHFKRATSKAFASHFPKFASFLATKGAPKWMKRLGIDGLGEEIMEEEINIPLNALLVGDNKLSDLGDLQQQSDIIFGIGLSVGAMYALNAAPKGAAKIYNTAQYYRFKNEMNSRDARANELLGDKWTGLKERIDNTPNEDMKELGNEIHRMKDDGTLTNEQIKAVLDYTSSLSKVRGYNLAKTMEAQAKEETGEETTPEEKRKQEQEQAYAEGQNAEGEEKHEIQQQTAEAESWLASLLGIPEDQLEDTDLDSMLGENDELDLAIYDYQNTQARYRGVMDNAQSAVDAAEENARAEVRRRTDVSRGTVRNATIKSSNNDVNGGADYGVYIVSGNVAQNEDGTINVADSDKMILYFDPLTGKIEHADASRFASIGEEVDAEQTVQETAELARQDAIAGVARDIDGMVREGNQFVVVDNEGQSHTYEVLADNGDGTASISIDGNVMENVFPTFAELQKMRDDTDKQRIANTVAGRQAEREKQQAVEEQRKQEAEQQVDAIDFSQLIDPNGTITPAIIKGEEDENKEAFVVGYTPSGKLRIAYLNNDWTIEKRKGLVAPDKVLQGEPMSVDAYKKLLGEQPIEQSTNTDLVDEDATKEVENSGNADISLAEENDESSYVPVTDEEADAIIADMENRAEPAADIPLTLENWEKEFGEDGTVQTPIGEVKMGENQVAKLFDKKRSKEFGMIRPTLENPDIIIEVPSTAVDGNGERPSSYLFVKTFLGKNGKKIYYFKSVTIKKEGLEISVSSHYDRANRVKEDLKKGKLLYRVYGGAQTEQNQPSASVTTSQEGNAGSSEGKDNKKSSNDNEEKQTLTFNDGTPVPMLEDGNPDFSQMTAEQTAELYDSQFGEDAEQVLSTSVSDAKKALDKAKGKPIKGKTFMEQKASKEANDKDVADAQATYDNSKAVMNAYQEMLIDRSLGTAEGRSNLLDKAKRKFDRLKNTAEYEDDTAKQQELWNETVGKVLHRLYDSTSVDVFDPEPRTVEEYVSSNLTPYSLNYEGTETAKGVKQETGLERKDFAKSYILAAEGKGKTVDAFVHKLWENRPPQLENASDQDIRNAVIGLITGNMNAYDMRHVIENNRIAEAEKEIEDEQAAAENAAYQEEQRKKADEAAIAAEETLPSEDDSSEKEEVPSGSEEDQDEEQLTENTADSMPFGGQLNESDLPFSKRGHKESESLKRIRAKYDLNDSASIMEMIENNQVGEDDISDADMSKSVRKAIKRLAKMMGVDVKYVHTLAGANGIFSDNTIYIALDVPYSSQFVIGHEMTHDIRKHNPSAYESLKELFLNSYAERDLLIRIAQTMSNYKELAEDDIKLIDDIIRNCPDDAMQRLNAVVQRTGGSKGYDDLDRIIEEVVADDAGDFIENLNLLKGLSLKMDHPLLAAFHNVLLKIRLAFRLSDDGTYERFTHAVKVIEKAYVDTAKGTFESSGSGVRFSLKDNVEQANERFNNEIEDFKNKSHKGLMHLGAPSPILKACGVNVAEITLSPKVLNKKLNQHSLSTDDVKDLVKAIQNPIMVYKHGKVKPNIVVITNTEIRGNKLSVALELDADGNVTELNNVSSIHDKNADTEVERLLDFTPEEFKEAMKWCDKKKVLDWISSAHLFSHMQTENSQGLSLAKIINDFENPSIDSEDLTNDNERVAFSLREKPEPEKKGIGYKVFLLKDGKLYPPMVANPNGAATPVGVWLDADAAPIAGESKTGRPQVKQGGKGTQGGSGKLAYRPGWHLGVIPYALQFNRKDAEGNKTLFPKNFVFAEVEYAADVDYQQEAHDAGINPSGKYQHSLAGLKHLPTDGYYMYRTNPNPETDPWVITGAMKVNRILTRAEQADLVKKAGREPQLIQDGDIVTDEVVNAINQEIANAPKFSLKVYHGSGADFDEFDFDHMGEGAGSQAFGWGGYVTSSKKIGKSYARSGMQTKTVLVKNNGKWFEFSEGDPMFRVVDEAMYLIKSEGLRGARNFANRWKDDADTEEVRHQWAKVADLLDNHAKADFKSRYPSHLYEVKIPDDNGKNYLEWYERVSSDVLSNIGRVLDERGIMMSDVTTDGDMKASDYLAKYKDSWDGQTLYIELASDLGGQKNASKLLSEVGFTGIKYPAGTIQGGAKEGDMNYVIFKPEDMKIAAHTKFSIRTYHGSQASFDHFDHSFMGSGEGAQAYGWGTYVSEVEGIARGYARQNTRKHSGGKRSDLQAKYHDEEFKRSLLVSRYNHVVNDIDYTTKNREKKQTILEEELKDRTRLVDTYGDSSDIVAETDRIIAKLQKIVARAENTLVELTERKKGLEKDLADSDKVIADLKAQLEENDEFPWRNLYTVEIPDDTGDNYISWDGKVSENAADNIAKGLVAKDMDAAIDMFGKYGNFIVRDEVKQLHDRKDEIKKDKLSERLGKAMSGFRGGAVYDDLADVLGGQKTASLFLKENGFDGVKVIAQRNSGGNKHGNMNYVIFDENKAQIVNHEKFSLRDSNDNGFSSRLKSAISDTDVNPSEAQKKSGNYKKGHIKFGGYDFTIENPKGSERKGVDANGKEWSVKMHDTYGYIRGKIGKDGDHLDMFINDSADLDNWNGNVYVVDQVNDDGSFDEHKVMYGYNSKADAKKAYLANYSKGWKGLGNITGVDKGTFDKWIQSSDRKTKPFSEYSMIRKADSNVRFSLAGLSGAATADKAEGVITRLQNFNIALQMEKEKKDAKAVKMATGWERGVDGKWRYEMPDAKLSEYMDIGGKKVKRFEEDMLWTAGKLGNVVDAPELFKAYPQLKDVELDCDSMTNGNPSNGAYDPARHRITIHASNLKYLNNLLNHEIQHAIQYIEGFAKGGNPNMFTDNDTRFPVFDELVKDKFGDANLETLTGIAEGKVPKYAAFKKEFGDSWKDFLSNLASARKYTSDKDFMDWYRKFVAQGKQGSAFDQYWRLAGEVEARNVENRLHMAPEERRNSLASETEDTPREEQQVLFSLKDSDKTLVGVHNISQDKLMKAIKQGGLANPSVAVIDSSKQQHEGYGEISLIMPSNKIAKRTGKNAGTWQGDAWTPTYPQVERQMDNKGSGKASKDVLSVPRELQSAVSRDIDRWLDNNSGNSGMAYLFLHEKGLAPQMKKTNSKYDEKVYNELRFITAGDFNIFGIGEADAKKVLDMYIDARYGGDRNAYEQKTKEWLDKNKAYFEKGKPEGFMYAKAKDNLELYDEYGFNYKSVQNFVRDVAYDYNVGGKNDVDGTLKAADDYIMEHGLLDDFSKWMNEKEKQYGVKEVIFDGFTPSGKRKYVANTLQNVSRIMKKQGRNGSSGIAYSFNNFAAKLMNSYGKLDDIRSKKGLLTSNHEDLDKFRDKWGEVFLDLGKKCQPDSENPFDDYGMERLSEAALHGDPQAYLKKEYNVDFSDKDMKRLNEMIKAIKEEYPAMYFETKFERPVMLDEFSSAVVPTSAQKEVKDALNKAGVTVFEYDIKKEGDRKRAFDEAVNSNNDIMFSIRAYHGTGAKFDSFDLSHALEGEGSETFGHGVYVTNSKEIGSEYAKRQKGKLSNNAYYHVNMGSPLADDWFRYFYRMIGNEGFEDAKKYVLDEFDQDIKMFSDAINESSNMDERTRQRKDAKLAEMKRVRDLVANTKEEDLPEMPHSYRYDVEIPDDDGTNYLTWNESINNIPLEKWAEMYDLLTSGGYLDAGINPKDQIYRIIDIKLDTPEDAPFQRLSTLKGEELYHALEDFYNREEPGFGAERASECLSKLGFVGIKYPAGMIHGGAKEGDYNYVIFHEADAKIVGNTKFSLRYSDYEKALADWKMRNGLSKDAIEPEVPQQQTGESKFDYMKRVNKYLAEKALWKTAPTYEGHLLSSDTAVGYLNSEMQRRSILARIAFQDSMLAVRKGIEGIMKELNLDKISMGEDAYTAENRSHGKGKNEFEEYNQVYLQPLRKAYHAMKKLLGDSYDNVKVYMMSKHGLERNAFIAFREALKKDFTTKEKGKKDVFDASGMQKAYEDYKTDINRINNDADYAAGKIDYFTYRQNDNAIRTNYAPSYPEFRYDDEGNLKDYAGLSALYNDAEDFEVAAAANVKSVEDAHKAEAAALWAATNAATKKILKDSYLAGMATKGVYDYVRGMYNYYIPLRGWDGTSADQVWDYVGGGRGAFNQVMKQAGGRKSIADDPIAYIENMAESGILLNNKNWVKQHLLLLAENHPTSMLTVSKAWYVKSKDNEGNDIWMIASPNIPADMNDPEDISVKLAQFEKNMKDLEAQGEATQKRGYLNIEYPQTKGEEREHEVRVFRDGEEYVVYVNGDPQFAQAMNNSRATKVRESQSGLLDRGMAWLGRKMAAAYTSLSPLFIPANFTRDLTMTLASTAIREDARYNYLLRKNFLKHWNTFPMVIKYQNGKLRQMVEDGSASETEKMFYDFMMNGGETGFVNNMEVEDFKRKIQDELKDMDRMRANPKRVLHAIMDSIELLNRAIEDSNRFLVYMTSIVYGRPMEEAINNAKDVTLNFNRKGTGEYGWQMIRNLYLFINPAIQSLQTLGALAKHHPRKLTAVTSLWIASGVLVPVVNRLLMDMLGGDDDKDKYWNFSKWDRRNNFIMWVPFTKNFIKIPLAQEFRGFYAVGDMIASKLMGGEKAEESWEDYAADLAGHVMDMLPLDPTGYDGNFVVSLMPNAIRPILELAFNVDFTGKPLFKDSEYNKYDPNFTKAYVGTPDWLVRTSKLVNSIGNPYPDVQQNAIDRFGNPRYNLNNPAVVDHVLSSYLGGAYTFGSQALGVLTKSLNSDSEIQVADIPVLSRFAANPDDRPVSKKQGDAFWTMKEQQDRTTNTLSKLKKEAKVSGDFSLLEVFFKSDQYAKFKENLPRIKQYEEDKKKERAESQGEEYKPHKTTGSDIYKKHASANDDFEDMKMDLLWKKVGNYKTVYDGLVSIGNSQSERYYSDHADAISAADEASTLRSNISELKKSMLTDEGKDGYNAEDMKQIRELRKQVISILEKAAASLPKKENE